MLHITKKHWKNRLISLLLTVLAFLSALMPAFAQEILLYEDVESFPVTGGVTYEAKTLFTSQGWQKIHILRADLTSENVEIDTIIGKGGLSKRDSLNRMVQDNGAVAGINGDFFIMATPSAPIGPQIKNGKLVSSPLNLNDMAAIGLTFDSIPQILNMEFSGKVVAPDGNEFEVEGVNKIRNSYNKIFVYTPDFGTTTPKPAEGAPVITFATIKDDRIIEFTEGNVADVPTDGLVLMSWGEGATFLKTHFTIGDPVMIELNIIPDISDFKMALGGGAVLLENGSIPKTFSHNIPGTHPRSAIGFSADKKTLIMAVVDGRQAQSRGMSQQEMAELMLNLGAHNALNLDGGGSSTMVVRPFGETHPKVFNTVSEGVQRLIPNAVGIFSKSSVGKVNSLKISASSFNIAKGGSRTFEVKAFDKNYNLVDIDSEKVKWSVNGDLGYFNGNVFTAERSGTTQVTASLGSIKTTQDIKVLSDNAVLSVEPSKAQVNPGAKVVFNVYVTDSEGFKAPLDSNDIKWNIVGDIGYMNGVEFTASQQGSGAVIADFSELKAGALIQTGYHSVLIDDFENPGWKSFSSYPADVKGSFNITSLPDPVYAGQFSGRLAYDFSEGTATRAAYLAFENKILPTGATKLGLWVYGQGKGEWLRAAVRDASGKETVLNLAKSIDWSNWRWVEVSLPAGKAPFTLKTIYVVETDPEKKVTGAVYLDDLTAMIAGKYDESLLPPIPKWVDAANQKGSGFTFGALGTGLFTKNNLSDYDKTLAIAQGVLTQYKSGFNAVVGHPWADEETLKTQLSGLKNYRVSGTGYSVLSEAEAVFIFLDATKGGLRTTDYNQWINLKNDLSTMDKSKALFVVIDKTPESFSDPLEGELLKKVLTEHAKSSGSGVWVLSGGGTAPFSSRAIDGVHYVSIPGINSTEPAVAVFNVSNGKVNYQVIPLIEKITAETTGVKAGIATKLKIYGITPANGKIPLGYPYAGEWNVSYDKPVGFDSKTLAFKAVDPGIASVQVNVGGILQSFPIQITDISVVVNGKEVYFPDQVPYINKDNRTMVPVRFVSESLGAKVDWDNENRMVIIERDKTIVKLKIGESKADVNGKTVSFDTSAVLQNDRTMVPARFISEALGAKVGWNQETKTVEIEY